MLESLNCRSSDAWAEFVFNIVLLRFVLYLPTAYIFFSDANLRRFYAPLSQVVKFSIVLSFLYDFGFSYAYLVSRSNHTTDLWNCSMLVTDRIQQMTVLFGEMHLIFFLSHVLGLGGRNIRTGICGITLPMGPSLTLSAMILFVSMLYTFYNRKALTLMLTLWTLLTTYVELYTIRISKEVHASAQSLITADDVALQITEKLLWLQGALVVASGIEWLHNHYFFYNVFYFFNHYFFSNNSLTAATAAAGGTETIVTASISLQVFRTALQTVAAFLFYLKVIVVKERCNVTFSYP